MVRSLISGRCRKLNRLRHLARIQQQRRQHRFVDDISVSDVEDACIPKQTDESSVTAAETLRRSLTKTWQDICISSSKEELRQWRTVFTKMVEEIDVRLRSAEDAGSLVSSVTSTSDNENGAAVTSQVLDAMDRHLAATRPNDTLCERFGVHLTRRHLVCLRPGNWLNDEVINCHLQLLQEQHRGDTWCPNTFFWPKLLAGGYAAVQRWSRRAQVHVADLRLILVPMHLGGNHWALASVEVQRRRLRYLDSLGLTPPKELLPLLRSYIDGECRAVGRPVGDSLTFEKDNAPLPLQQNGSDCGVFLCLFSERVASGAPLSFDGAPTATERARYRIMQAIFDGFLPPPMNS